MAREEERMKNLLLDVAAQPDKWVLESMTGGWSTHQVKPMRELAMKIRFEVLGSENDDPNAVH